MEHKFVKEQSFLNVYLVVMLDNRYLSLKDGGKLSSTRFSARALQFKNSVGGVRHAAEMVDQYKEHTKVETVSFHLVTKQTTMQEFKPNL